MSTTGGPVMRELQGGDLIPGTQLKIVKILGRGGQGTVYECVHGFLERPCVVKVLNTELAPEKESVARVEAEAKALAAMKHPSIVVIMDGGLTDEQHPRPFFVMEKLAGVTLHDLLRTRPGGLNVRFSISIAIDLLEGLECAHVGHGIVHRDIKPGNIFLNQIGPSQTVAVLLDFGVAKRLSRTTQRNAFVGTFQYAAPEQLEGKASPSVDIYAIGICLFEMITGQHPFVGCKTSRDYADAHLNRRAPRLSSLGKISPALDALVASALEKNPARRPATAYQFASALKAIRETLDIEETARVSTQAETDEMPMDELLARLNQLPGSQITNPGGRGAVTPVVPSNTTEPTAAPPAVTPKIAPPTSEKVFLTQEDGAKLVEPTAPPPRRRPAVTEESPPDIPQPRVRTPTPSPVAVAPRSRDSRATPTPPGNSSAIERGSKSGMLSSVFVGGAIALVAIGGYALYLRAVRQPAAASASADSAIIIASAPNTVAAPVLSASVSAAAPTVAASESAKPVGTSSSAMKPPSTTALPTTIASASQALPRRPGSGLDGPPPSAASAKPQKIDELTHLLHP